MKLELMCLLFSLDAIKLALVLKLIKVCCLLADIDSLHLLKIMPNAFLNIVLTPKDLSIILS